MANDQLFRRRKRATETSLRRRVVNRQPNKRILIVCEGKETERRYFDDFVSRLDLKAVEVEVHGGQDGSAPINVVDYAARKALSEGLPEDGGYEFVFCVFDRDSHESYERAKSKIHDLSKSKFPGSYFEAITSIPCFELWLLYHFRYTRFPFSASAKKSPCECLIGEIKRTDELRNYRKALTRELLDCLLSEKATATAIKNGRNAIVEAEATGEENPSTLIFKIIECLLREKDQEAKEAQKSKGHY